MIRLPLVLILSATLFATGVYGVPLPADMSRLIPAFWKILLPPTVGPSPGPKRQSRFAAILWRWSKSSGDVCLGGFDAVQAMLRCEFDTEPVPCAYDSE